MPNSHLLPPADDPFWIDDPLTVHQIMSELARHSVGLKCWIDRAEPVEASVAEVRESGDMTLRFAAGQVLPPIPRSGNPVVVLAQLGSARISFLLHDLQRDSAGGSALGVSSLPLSVNRLQRREFFRVPSPVSLLCELPGAGSGLAGHGHRRVRLIDISLGGVCLALPVGTELPVALGETLQGCSLDLPGFGVIHFALQFLNRPDEALRSREQLVGARFVGLTPREQTLLQRFLYKLQADAHD